MSRTSRACACASRSLHATPRERKRSAALHRRFEEYIRWFRQVPPDILLGVMQQKDCGDLGRLYRSEHPADFEQKQCILDELHPEKRIAKLNDILSDEIKVLSLEREISQKAQEQMDENQRVYMLREQMRAIASELGEEDNPQEESDEFRQRIEKLNLPQVAREKLLKECDRLAKMPYGSHEGSVMRVYLETCLELPWNTSSKERLDLDRAEKILNRDHYGMEKVKARFLETLAVRKLSDQATGQIICLVGPPGVGKTSIARSIAEATGRKYVRVSLGGVRDEADIMGHRRTYVGSMPGRIMAAVKQAGTNNPLILLDEIDKLGRALRAIRPRRCLRCSIPNRTARFQTIPSTCRSTSATCCLSPRQTTLPAIPGPLYD